MDKVENLLNDINESFNFEMKTFKLNLLKKIAKGIKKNVKGKNVNVEAIKKLLKPFPSMSQEKLNKFLSKYIPNYIHNYKITEKHFKKKYPKEENIDTLIGSTALIASIDKDKSLQQQIQKSDRIYSYTNRGGGGAFVMFVVGLGIVMVVFSVDYISPGIVWMSAVVGAFIMLSSVLSLLR